ncbi:FtsK/SpoIIIE domain-containing protein [Peribacillus loiseleuriae]|uniref:FtsK/SpoIIIE domain-containing protein n=1 Tax=Peribacillus loiseleuriae TaxID=1679170 RepID=UPI00380DEB31
MLVEVGSTIIMAGVAGYSYLKTSGSSMSDADKIQRIFNNAGMNVREKGKVKTIRIHRKTKIEGGIEYVFQLPLGMSAKQIIDHKNVLEDGLNARHKVFEFDPTELLSLKWDRTVIKQIMKILTSKKIIRKEIDIDFDGMLRIRVYDSSLGNEIQWSDDMLQLGTWSVPIGITRNGTIYHDFDKRKHLIVAGATGFGKSVIMKAIITALILSKPNEVTFSLIDLKGGPAFARFKDAKQVVHFGVDTTDALDILQDVQQKMNDDYKKIVDGGYEDVSEAGISKRHFLVVDEAADLAGDQKSMEILTDIVRKGRGAGYYVIYATQYPSAQAIPMQIKRNIPARLCFVLDSAMASMTVLDGPGAESLPEIPGRGIYKEVKQTILQTPYMSNKQIQERIQPHVTIRTRRDDGDGQKSLQTTTTRRHSIVIEKV